MITYVNLILSFIIIHYTCTYIKNPNKKVMWYIQSILFLKLKRQNCITTDMFVPNIDNYINITPDSSHDHIIISKPHSIVKTIYIFLILYKNSNKFCTTFVYRFVHNIRGTRNPQTNVGMGRTTHVTRLLVLKR